ncbi:hypothetical protein HPB50_012665 [Hyalomma asiaticum]|uniref:Uncharacterized protein n=1 Tax=Hyalomma asiaticum TaxID=266040 RepID=A0ACB7T9Z7_HYAAI|nr:hypothetical protein HPB50_012665 [Hyalomma asiaticum]
MLSKPSAPAPRMYKVSAEMFRPPLPLELWGALPDKLCRSSRRPVPATAFLRQLRVRASMRAKWRKKRMRRLKRKRRKMRERSK